MNRKALITNWVPPSFIRFAQNALDYVRPAPWEYVREGWRTTDRMRGWNVPSVADAQKRKWEAYQQSLRGTAPLGINHESRWKPTSGDLRDHNTLVSFAYVLALAAWQKQRLSLLDWGGGMGHYYVLSKALLPTVDIDYFCHDVSLLCQAGREVLPQAHFFDSPQEAFSRSYDFVLASSSVWYEEEWRPLLDKLIRVADPYLYVSRMIFVNRVPSYVAVQRPWAVGYGTEYLCWILNKKEFLDHVLSRGMELVREFLISSAQHIHRAPEQGDYRGFLFRKQRESAVADS